MRDRMQVQIKCVSICNLNLKLKLKWNLAANFILPVIMRDSSFSFCFAVDTNSEWHGGQPSNDNARGHLLEDAEPVVAPAVAVNAVEAVAAVRDGGWAWRHEAHDHHNKVPWFVDLLDLCAARLVSVEVWITLDKLVAHLKIIIN